MGLIKDTTALDKLRQRLQNKPAQVDNSTLPAGSPMFFYCRICGYESDRLPESYVSQPRRYCNDCRELKDVNPELTDGTILEEARK